MNDISHYNKIFSNAHHIHFTGIGGVSMSALANIAQSLGKKVTGSDIAETDTIISLRQNGIAVAIGHAAENAVGCDLLVYTAAVKDNNPELIYAKTNQIPHFERATLLGLLMLQYPKSIAVSGTHGKTTTTSMLASIFLQAQRDPTVLVGAHLSYIGGNFRIGASPLAVYEACEYCNSFWNFYPHTAVILNIDEDHLDFFKDVEDIIDSFVHFSHNTSPDGRLIVNGDDPHIDRIVQSATVEVLKFGLEENCQLLARNLKMNDGQSQFDVWYNGALLGTIVLGVPGKHNVYNALAAIACALTYDIEFSAIKIALSTFSGADRRFQKKGSIAGADVIDDYAHHPAEISATIQAARDAGYKNVTVIFQPHTFTRTKLLLQDFADVLQSADHVILTDIYSAREINTIGANILDLRDKIDGCQYIGNFEDIAAYITTHAKKDTVFILMGAGNINQVASLLPLV